MEGQGVARAKLVMNLTARQVALTLSLLGGSERKFGDIHLLTLLNHISDSGRALIGCIIRGPKSRTFDCHPAASCKEPPLIPPFHIEEGSSSKTVVIQPYEGLGPGSLLGRQFLSCCRRPCFLSFTVHVGVCMWAA